MKTVPIGIERLKKIQIALKIFSAQKGNVNKDVIFYINYIDRVLRKTEKVAK